ncbi:MAG: ABC transporter ATP-binding protein [Bacteroidia bacterium]|nr:ABC transporter ATP-binding protein [Bacteroidia bacterium]
MIRVSNLDKSFGKLKALNKVQFTAEKGECIALLGPNGCGKTTLIKCLLGMVIPDNGTILIKGESIQGNWEYKKQMGYMPQIGRYPENMTIEQLFTMVTDLRKSNTDLDLELENEFQIKKIQHQLLGQLSGGTRQKISACLAFLFNPDILILDEPTAGLDPLSSEILKSKIQKEVKNGKVVLITSHILSELDDLVSHVMYMEEGKIHFQKTMEELKKDTGTDRLNKAIAHYLRKQLI